MFRYRHAEVRQEEDEIPWGRVGFAFVAMVVIGGVLTIWAWAALEAHQAALRPSGVFPERDLGPRHEVGMVQQELFDHARIGQDLVDAQREQLTRFGVVDRAGGVVSIPIDAAIDLLVKEGK